MQPRIDPTRQAQDPESSSTTTTEPERTERALTARLRPTVARVVLRKESGLVGVLLALCLVIGLANDQFFTISNLTDVARSSSFMVIVAVAATLVLISGNLDLSVGSTYALGGVAAGLALTAGLPVWIAVPVGLLAGALVGVINAFVVITLRVPALIATLGMLYAVRGVVLVITGGAPVFPLAPGFVEFGRSYTLGIPNPVWVAGVVAVLGHLCLSRTVLGRQIYALGGNPSAAYLAGAPVMRVRATVFLVSGMAAALGGMLAAARTSSAQVNAGEGLELLVVAAVIIGGTSLFGGSGSVFGSVLGVLLMAVITNGLVLARIDAFYQNVVVGVIIILAVALDTWQRRRLAER